MSANRKLISRSMDNDAAIKKSDRNQPYGLRTQLNPLPKSPKRIKRNSLGDSVNRNGKLSVEELMAKAEATMQRTSSTSAIKTLTVNDGRIKSVDSVDQYDMKASQLFAGVGPPVSARYGKRLASISSDSSLGSSRSVGSFDDEMMMMMDSARMYGTLTAGATSSDLTYATARTGRMTQRTSREMIQDVRTRAEKNLHRPDYVPSIDELSPRLISWNKQLKLSARSFESAAEGLNPKVNIIGCMHPIELILAKADIRIRNQREVLKKQQQNCEEKVRQIDESIKWKFSRAERYAAAFAHMQRQVIWMRICVLTAYLKRIQPKFLYRLRLHRDVQDVFALASKIQSLFIRWYNRHCFIKYRLNFQRVMRRNCLYFILQMRVNRKRKAVHRLKTFFAEYKGHHKMSTVVHKYVHGVRRAQRFIRSFLACKRARVTALEKWWVIMEIKYVGQMLQKKKAKKRGSAVGGAGVAGGGVDSLEITREDKKNKAIVEMKNQARVWKQIDDKMESSILQFKVIGVIPSESDEQAIDKLLLPAHIRIDVLTKTVDAMRKDFFAMHKNKQRKEREQKSVFSHDHARELLMGVEDNFSRIINERCDKRRILRESRYPPFFLYTVLKQKDVLDKVKLAHEQAGTFRINIEELLKAVHEATASGKHRNRSFMASNAAGNAPTNATKIAATAGTVAAVVATDIKK